MPPTPHPPNLENWIFVKKRGALVRHGAVFRSPDGSQYLRTGQLDVIRKESDFLLDAARRKFPVPRVLEAGTMPDGLGYFIENSAGSKPFAHFLEEDYSATGKVSEKTFQEYCNAAARFLAVQLAPENRQSGSRRMDEHMQLPNVIEENPDLDPVPFRAAIAKSEQRTAEIPLVLTHGDFTPFNVMHGGIIDFEQRFVAPAGYDKVTGIVFQRIWDHPLPDNTGTMLLWDFTQEQIDRYLARMDSVSRSADAPPVSGFFDDFLVLKAIWALSHEHPEGRGPGHVNRWQWRRRVALYCVMQYLNDQRIESEHFYHIGLDQPIPKKVQLG